MRHYENLVIVKPTLTQEEIEKGIAAIEEVLTSNGAEIAARSKMGIRKLAYPIQKNERGYFHVVYYTATPSVIAEIERRFRINEDLLRFITIKYDSKREVIAWEKLVQKANTIEAAPKEETVEAAAEVVVEEVVVEEVAAEEVVTKQESTEE
jgi:small subunit ribosomal protein S6